MEKDKKDVLFQPFTEKELSLKNRIVMAPMTRSRAIDHLPNDSIAAYYCQRSSAGLIISESISPSPNGLGYPRIPGIFNVEQVDGWRKVTDAVHEEGGKIFAQITHAGRVGSKINLPDGAALLAPSAISAGINVWTDVQGLVPSDVPRPMSELDITKAISEFADAAKNAIEAGFDGVELHGANGYLLEQFLNPHSNNRTDGYGGTAINRCRFVIEVADAVVKAIGAEKVGIRLSPYNTMNGMLHYDEIFESYHFLAEAMNDLRLLYVHLIDTVSRLGQDQGTTGKALTNCFREVRRAFKGLVILNGGYTKERAISDLKENKADLISFGVPFISNPDLPYRLEHNLELVEADTATFYSPTQKGFTDYPTYKEMM